MARRVIATRSGRAFSARAHWARKSELVGRLNRDRDVISATARPGLADLLVVGMTVPVERALWLWQLPSTILPQLTELVLEQLNFEGSRSFYQVAEI